ncbi:MAG TPA: VOC family protein [Beutenbergiaceae bacterium]|nr:VOC family protein [Beutenbergiaceae bacterium]
MSEVSAVTLDHQIVLARDKEASARFLAKVLGLGAPEKQGIFSAVHLDNGVTILFKSVQTDFPGQHYAFRVPPEAFPTVRERVHSMGIKYWSTPKGDGVGKTYELNGETGFYFHDPNGHQLEVLTQLER